MAARVVAERTDDARGVPVAVGRFVKQ